MKTIKQDELFQSLEDFLKGKGVELKDGVYSLRIRQGCNLLSEAINATQKTVKHAKVKADKKLEQLRQSIHAATAPKPPPAAAAPKASSANAKKETGKPRRKRPSASKRASQRP